MMEQNLELRETLRRYHITYNELLPYLSNFSHTTRISEELAKPMSEERKELYFNAIEEIRRKKIEFYES